MVLNIKRGRQGIETLSRLIRAGLGEEKADLVLRGGRLVNVYSGEILPDFSVAIKGERIVYVGKDPAPLIGERTQVLELDGKVICPGFIDAHTHLHSLCTPQEYLRFIIPTGTTTIITEIIELALVLGYKGLKDFLAALHGQPIKIFALVPPLVTPSPRRSYGLRPKEVRRLLRREDVLGLGEIYWGAVVRAEGRLLRLLTEAHDLGKNLEGHAAGARDHKLAAYIAAGVDSCHESISPQDILERLRSGLYTLIREGTVRHDLEALVTIREKNIDWRRLVLCSDGVDPAGVIKEGYMDAIVQKAIKLGISPVRAIQMVTLNPAEQFSLDHLIGGIAPGRCADILVLPDLELIRPELVISNGRIIAQEGIPTVPPRRHRFPEYFYRSVSLRQRIEKSTFSVPAPISEGEVAVRVVDQVTELVTREVIETLPVMGGQIGMDSSRDILKAAVVDRGRDGGKVFTGFLRGFGLKRGAFAASDSWDSTGIIVIGAAEEDMALAVNRIAELRGGIVVAAEGKIEAELPLPLGGYISDLPIEEVALRCEKINEKLRLLGCSRLNPHLSLVTLTTAAIPHLRFTERGLVDIKENRPLDLIA